MPTEAKVREVEEFSGVLSSAESIILTDFTGLNVEALSQLRRNCREAGVQYRVIKNTLAKLAVEKSINLVDRLVAVHSVGPTNPCSCAKSNNLCWSCFLPLCSRDMTVPMGTSRISAISL